MIQSVDKKPRLLKKNINQPASNVLDLFLRRFFSSGHIFSLKMLLVNIDKTFRHCRAGRSMHFNTAASSFVLQVGLILASIGLWYRQQSFLRKEETVW